MKPIYKIALSLVAGLAMGAAFAASPQLPDAKVLKSGSYLFTQTATSASIKADPARPGWSKLILHQVNTKTVWFSDRPKRNAGVVNTSAFVEHWSDTSNADNFKVDPPNASLVAIEGDKSISTQAVFELSNPQYDATTQSLTYDVKDLSHAQVKNIDVAGTKHLREVALFIDNFGACNSRRCNWPH